MNDRTTEHAAVEQSSRRWPAAAGPPPRRSPRGEAVPPNQRSLRPHDGVQSNAKVYQANSSAGLWPGDHQRPQARETSGSPCFERQRSRLIGQEALRGRQDAPATAVVINAGSPRARRAVRTDSSGGFLPLSYLWTAARSAGKAVKCPRRRTDGIGCRFPCVATRHKLPPHDGINNTHDGDESGPNKPYRWLITSQDCNRIAKNRGWYHYEANRHCNGGSAARMREGAPGCRWKV